MGTLPRSSPSSPLPSLLYPPSSTLLYPPPAALTPFLLPFHLLSLSLLYHPLSLPFPLSSLSSPLLSLSPLILSALLSPCLQPLSLSLPVSILSLLPSPRASLFPLSPAQDTSWPHMNRILMSALAPHDGCNACGTWKHPYKWIWIACIPINGKKLCETQNELKKTLRG